MLPSLCAGLYPRSRARCWVGMITETPSCKVRIDSIYLGARGLCITVRALSTLSTHQASLFSSSVSSEWVWEDLWGRCPRCRDGGGRPDDRSRIEPFVERERERERERKRVKEKLSSSKTISVAYVRLVLFKIAAEWNHQKFRIRYLDVLIRQSLDVDHPYSTDHSSNITVILQRTSQ